MLYQSYGAMAARPGQVQQQQSGIVVQGQEPLTAHMLAQALPQVCCSLSGYPLQSLGDFFMERERFSSGML